MFWARDKNAQAFGPIPIGQRHQNSVRHALRGLAAGSDRNICSRGDPDAAAATTGKTTARACERGPPPGRDRIRLHHRDPYAAAAKTRKTKCMVKWHGTAILPCTPNHAHPPSYTPHFKISRTPHQCASHSYATTPATIHPSTLKNAISVNPPATAHSF